MTKIYLVQHGGKERVPGDPGLTDLGRQQAQVTAPEIPARNTAAPMMYCHQGMVDHLRCGREGHTFIIRYGARHPLGSTVSAAVRPAPGPEPSSALRPYREFALACVIQAQSVWRADGDSSRPWSLSDPPGTRQGTT